MGYDSVWQWRFEQYSDDDLRQWIRRVTPGEETEIDLMAIEELAGRVVANDAAGRIEPAVVPGMPRVAPVAPSEPS